MGGGAWWWVIYGPGTQRRTATAGGALYITYTALISRQDERTGVVYTVILRFKIRNTYTDRVAGDWRTLRAPRKVAM